MVKPALVTLRFTLLFFLLFLTSLLLLFRLLIPSPPLFPTLSLLGAFFLTIVYTILTCVLQYRHHSDDAPYSLSLSCRVLLPLSLWLWKLGIFATYFQNRRVLPQRLHWLCNVVGGAMITTLVVALTTTVEGAEKVKASGRSTGFAIGVAFAHLPAAEGFVGCVMNLISDVFLLALAAAVISSLRNVRARADGGWLLYVMGALTVGVALLRLVLMAVHAGMKGRAARLRMDDMHLSIVVSAEAEVMVTGAVSCLPGVRAGWRAAVERAKRRIAVREGSGLQSVEHYRGWMDGKQVAGADDDAWGDIGDRVELRKMAV